MSPFVVAMVGVLVTMMLALVRSPMRDMLSARPSISHSLLPEGGLPAGCWRKPCRTVMPRPSKVWTSKPACVRSLEGRPRTHSLLMVERASLPLSAEPITFTVASTHTAWVNPSTNRLSCPERPGASVRNVSETSSGLRRSERSGTHQRLPFNRAPHGPVSAREFLANSRLADRAPEQVAFLRRLPDGATSTHQSGRRSTSLPPGDLSSRSFGPS